MSVKAGNIIMLTKNVPAGKNILLAGQYYHIEEVMPLRRHVTVFDENAQRVAIQYDEFKVVGAREGKETNPKDAVGVGKVPFSTIPANVLGEVGLALMEGARKYGRHNYRVAGVRGSVYYDASLRHLTDWWEGVDDDPASGLHHVSKAIAGLIVLRDSMMRGNWTDDRPPPSTEGWQQDLNEKAKALIEKYPNCADAAVRK